jgi:hypothetical protein
MSDEPRVIAVAHHAPEMLPLAVDMASTLGAGGHEDVGLDRHWLRGPHLRVWLGPDADETAIADLARVVVSRHPSGRALDDGDYLRRSRLLGDSELVPGPYLPLRPDDSVSAAPEAAVTSVRLIGRDAVGLKRQVLAALRPAVAASGRLAEWPPAVRLVPVMIVLAARWEVGGVRSGYLTFRSHLEDHLALHDATGALRARFSARLAAARPVLGPLVTSTIESVTLDGELRRGEYTGADPVVRAWSAAFGAAIALARAAADQGVITEDFGDRYARIAREGFAEQEARWTFDAARTYSDFHLALRSLDTRRERIHARPFAAYRFTVNQFLRIASLLDVSPVDRYFASFAVSELVEEHFGMTWGELLDSGREERIP